MPANNPTTEFTDKRVLVMGLGHFGGGLGAAQWLAAQGAQVIVTDAAPAEKLADSIQALEAASPGSFRYRLGGHEIADLDHCDLLVVNPAVDRAKSPFVQAALAKNVPTTTEINLFLERCPARAIGITGSVGKSTTTALIHHALKAALHQSSDEPTQDGPRVFLGGNIGRSLLFDLPHIRPQDLVVLELSSFMLEETPNVPRLNAARGWSPHIAVITNIFPNHLDRHGTMEAYAAAKQHILRFQTQDDIAILNGDHDIISTWNHVSPAKVVKFHAPPSHQKLDLVMPGIHNQSNAAAALAVLDALQIPLDRPAARAAISQFPGLAHRLQCVYTALVPTSTHIPRRVRCFNDSKATSPDASLTAIQTFDPGTAVFIIGGYDKHLADSAFEKFDQLLAQRALGVLGIGATGQAMIDRIQKCIGNIRPAERSAPRLAYVSTLDQAITRAREWARDLPVQALVLSPASASWDQFPNYEKRGETFSDLVRLHFTPKNPSK